MRGSASWDLRPGWHRTGSLGGSGWRRTGSLGGSGAELQLHDLLTDSNDLLTWQVGFSRLAPRMTMTRTLKLYALPETPQTRGLRQLREGDCEVPPRVWREGGLGCGEREVYGVGRGRSTVWREGGLRCGEREV